MHEASERCHAVLAVLSERYLESVFAGDEWTSGFRDRKLLPVRVGGDRPGGLFGPVVSIDLVDLDEETARKRLLEGAARFLAIQRGEEGRAKPKTAPLFPRPTVGRSISAPAPFPGGTGLRHLPRGPKPNFTGREPQLDEIAAKLAVGGRIALTGLGGLGKSRLAIEYAHRHAADYEIVWWLRAETAATLVEDLALLAIALGLVPPGAADLGEAADLALRRLEGESRWLLIFDDAPGPDEIDGYLPKSGAGHVIGTSRELAWRELAPPLRLPTLPPEDAAAFLVARSGDDDLKGAAPALAMELGRLPLALEQAGAYVEENRTTLAAYLDAFRTHQAELLREGVPGDYPAPVATAWELSFRAIEKEAPAAAVLLELLAFFAPDAIPMQLFLDYQDHLPDALTDAVARPLGFDRDGVRPALRYSLVEREGESLSIHRLVQAVTRERIGCDRRTSRITEVVSLIAAAFRFDPADPLGWTWCGRLLPHALAASSHADGQSINQEIVTSMLNTAGLYLQSRAQFGEARAAFERALRIDEAVYGSEHPRVATDVNNLGTVLRDLGELVEARAALERALQINEAVYGPEHPRVATAVNGLGNLLRDLGELVEARAAFERALRIDEAVYRSEHPRVATDVNNLGTVLRDLGELVEARAAFERAVSIYERRLGPEHNYAKDSRKMLEALNKRESHVAEEACANQLGS
jgi:tetratricopeptide (TPR) repeat protein